VLRETLKLLVAGRVASVSQLAGQLGQSESLVLSVLEELVRRGLVQVLEGCQMACESCGASGCAIAAQGRAFVVSDAGRALLERAT
jgi:hypothetical protein